MNPQQTLERFTYWTKSKVDAIRRRPSQEALFNAIEIGDATGVQICLKSGASPNLRDPTRSSPLQAAARVNSLACVRALLSAKANAKEPPAILYAACFSSAEIIEALIEHGADPNAPDAKGENDGMRPILWASRHGNLAALEQLHKQGGSLTATTDKTKLGALALAAHFNGAQCAKWLIEHGADPMTRDVNGDFAGLPAAKHASPECLMALLAAGTPVDARGERGMTMAMTAALADNAVALAVLEAAGADFDLRMDGRKIGGGQGPTIQAFTALELAERNKKHQSLSWLKARQERLELGLATLGSDSRSRGAHRI